MFKICSQVQAAVLDLAKFGKVVKLESFLPFKSGANALENINSISEGKVLFSSESVTVAKTT